jgi:hypothetical protein
MTKRVKAKSIGLVSARDGLPEAARPKGFPDILMAPAHFKLGGFDRSGAQNSRSVRHSSKSKTADGNIRRFFKGRFVMEAKTQSCLPVSHS